MQLGKVGMLDLPASGHLLDDQFGIHRHRDFAGVQFRRLLQTRYQAAIFGDVVGGVADCLLALGQHDRPVGTPHHRPVAGRPRVAARSPVGLDDDLHWLTPLSRNRIALHSGHRSTSSSAAAEIRASSPRSISIRHAPQRPPCISACPGPAAGALSFVERQQVRSQLGGEFVAARRVNTPVVIDIGECCVESMLSGGQIGLQRLDDRLLRGLLVLQLLAMFHHLQQRILQAGLAALQGLQFVLQLRQLLGICHGLQQRAVPILALAHPVDLRLETRDLSVQVFQRDLQSPQPVAGGDLLGLDPLDLGTLGQVAGAVVHLGQLCVELGDFEQRALLCDFGFHASSPPPALSTFQGSVRIRHTSTDSAAPNADRKHVGSLLAPREFAGPMGDVDQRDVGCAAVLVGRVVTQIRRHIGLHVGGRDGAQQRVARAAAHRDPRHRSRPDRPRRALPTTSAAAPGLTRETNALNGSGCGSEPIRPSPTSPGSGASAMTSNAGSSYGCASRIAAST